MDRQIKGARRAAMVALTLEEKLAGQRVVRDLKSKRNAKRKSLFAAQDKIEAHRDELIRQVEGKLEMKLEQKKLFGVRWRIQ